MGAALAAGRRRLARGSPARLVLAGGVLVVGVAAAAAVLAAGVLAAVAPLGAAASLVVEAALLKSTLALRGLGAAALEVARAVEAGDLPAARGSVGHHLVSRPTASLDAPRVASAAVESVAENLTDALVAPLLFYAVLGVPGAVFYRAVNTADAMIGYREGVLEHFGKVAARLDDALNLVPARVAAAALVLAAPLAGGRPGGALAVLRRDAGRTASPNAGWTMAAMAGALGVELEKPGHYRLGEGGRPPDGADIRRSIRATAAAAALVAGAVAAALAR